MKRLCVTLLAVAAVFGAGHALSLPPVPAPNPHWVASWATAQQIVEAKNALPALHDATLRQVVHLSLGGTMLRVHISNVFGTAPLHLTAVHIARPGTAPGSIDAASDQALRFSGRADVTIPAGADFISDTAVFAAPPLSDLVITLHYDDTPAQQTGHPGSRATSFYMPGDHVADAVLPGATPVDHWYQIEGVDVASFGTAGAVIVLGDSITDGRGSTTNGNDRWTDALAHRLRRSPPWPDVAVLNKGIGGGRLLQDGIGPSALARFDHDVLAPASVKWLIVLEGINDLDVLTRDAPATAQAHAAMVVQLIAGYEQIIARAHAHGIKVYGATILSDFGGAYYHPDAQNEADRHAVNAWIRARGHFDAVIDFDAALHDPVSPDALLPAYDSGDHLHPNPAGYRAMADAVPLALFAAPVARPRKHRK